MKSHPRTQGRLARCYINALDSTKAQRDSAVQQRLVDAKLPADPAEAVAALNERLCKVEGRLDALPYETCLLAEAAVAQAPLILMDRTVDAIAGIGESVAKGLKGLFVKKSTVKTDAAPATAAEEPAAQPA